jgi:2,4-dienoyl-CoA reductase-like NADH-dependent reductase (Old Yellow Enzyme family)
MISLKKFYLNKIKLNNRICIAPMCQYSANNGNPSEWHYFHLKKLMQAGSGLLIIESTAISKEGMISKNDLSLYNKKNFTELKKLYNYLRNISDTKIGIQLSHSGRKGSSSLPWIKPNFPLNSKTGWKTIAPSKIKRDKHWPNPKEANLKDLNKIKLDFIKSTIYAKKIGFDCLEVHMAHGYLLHQFFSPLSNKRKDSYGNNLKNRCKYLLEIATAIRKIWPKNRILGARVSGSDWMKKGASITDCIFLCKNLKRVGFNYVCVSSGGVIPKTKIKFKKGYQVHLARKIRERVRIKVKTTGNINGIKHAEEIIKSGKADLVSFGRKFINSPTWLIKELLYYKKTNLPNQYKRCF